MDDVSTQVVIMVMVVFNYIFESGFRIEGFLFTVFVTLGNLRLELTILNIRLQRRMTNDIILDIILKID